ncbi:MAG TPA: helix-turn-helix transcriptional regulator [Xanthomonadales bacterium]|nr:helix-turn-helix transcriptional regulator [Xanthomonadales bacterium]
MAKIGERIRAARGAANLSQADLALRVGVAQAAISRIERDETQDPGVLIVAGIAKALGVSLDQLVEGNATRRAPRKSLEDRVALLEDEMVTALRTARDALALAQQLQHSGARGRTRASAS